MIKKVIIVGHPNWASTSNSIRSIVEGIIKENNDIDLRVLDEKGNFDIKEEQDFLLKYDEIFYAFPFWWSSIPWTLKKYFDSIITPGYAYSFREPNNYSLYKLKGKKFGYITSVGGPKTNYGNIEVNPKNPEETLSSLTNLFKMVGTAYVKGEKYMYEPVIHYGASMGNTNYQEDIDKFNNLKLLDYF